MPPRPQSAAGEPSTYVFEMITFLTAYVDSVLIGLNEGIKTRAYRNALFRINRWLMVSNPSRGELIEQDLLCGRDVPRYNEPALANVLADVKFIEDEIRRLEKPALDKVLEEVRQVCPWLIIGCSTLLMLQTINIILSDAIPGYLEVSIRQSSYAAVKPKSLAIVLQKLAKGTAATPGGGSMNRSERRMMEAGSVSRLPGN